MLTHGDPSQVTHFEMRKADFFKVPSPMEGEELTVAKARDLMVDESAEGVKEERHSPAGPMASLSTKDQWCFLRNRW
ncbi:unnamed protein product [Taenia asiatica]|uniref:Uncharacterized protein n=1 Tax=Taenia asiatica TaxID=60517 RepID=A0A0R3W0W4_TAEAS|nr:unnamed protein product [Taenia asiatica]